MTDKELKRLSRAELLELLLTQMEENEKLRKQLRKAQAALRDRRIEIENVGSMAEAALRLTCIFEDADRAARLYLENIQRMARKGGEEL